MIRPLLAFATLVVLAVVVGGVLLSTEDAADELAFAPTATPIPDFTPPPAATTGPPAGRPPVPTPEPGREGPETTLVDTQNGGVRRLWEPGYRIHETVFSGDHLYYVRFPSGTGVQDAEIFAFNLSTHQDATKIADGFNIAVSANGDIAYLVWDPSGVHTAAIYDRFGRTQQVRDGGGGRFAWSPDGRWLTYSGPYQGDSPMKQYILDTTTHQSRLFAETLPCNCDGGPSVKWAPDSAHFLFARLAPDPAQPGPNSGPTARYISEVYVPRGGATREVPSAEVWLTPSDLLATESRQEQGIHRNYHTVIDLSTGVKTPVFEAGWGSAHGLSPDGTMMAASDQFTTRIVDRKGGVVLDSVQGEFYAWSPDGGFLLTSARSSSCGPALLVIRIADGSQVACSPAGPASGGAFDPDSTRVALLQSRWVVNPPPGSATPVTSDLVIADLASGAMRTVATDMRGHLRCLTWSADGRYVVVGVCGGV